MAEQTVNLKVKSSADTKALEKAAQALKEVDKVAGEAARALAAGDLPRVSESYDKLANSVRTFQKEVKTGVGPTIDLDQELRDANTTLNKSRIRLREAAKAARDHASANSTAAGAANQLDTQNQKVGRSSRNSGLAVLELSRGIEDLQYGVRGVLNNIPQLVLQLGGTAGLAGVISLVAVAAAQLGPLLFKDAERANELAEATKEANLASREYLETLARRFRTADANKLDDIIDAESKALSFQNNLLSQNLRLLNLRQTGEEQRATLNDELARTQVNADPSLSPLDRASQLASIDLAAEQRRANATLTAKLAEQASIAEQQTNITDRSRELTIQLLAEQANLRDQTIKERRLVEQAVVLREAINEVAAFDEKYGGLFGSSGASQAEQNSRAQAAALLLRAERDSQFQLNTLEDLEFAIQQSSTKLAEAREPVTRLQAELATLSQTNSSLGQNLQLIAEQVRQLNQTATTKVTTAVETTAINLQAKLDSQFLAAESQLSNQFESTLGSGFARFTALINDGIDNASQSPEIQAALQQLGTSQEARDLGLVSLIQSLISDLATTRSTVADLRNQFQTSQARGDLN